MMTMLVVLLSSKTCSGISAEQTKTLLVLQVVRQGMVRDEASWCKLALNGYAAPLLDLVIFISSYSNHRTRKYV